MVAFVWSLFFFTYDYIGRPGWLIAKQDNIVTSIQTILYTKKLVDSGTLDILEFGKVCGATQKDSDEGYVTANTLVSMMKKYIKSLDLMIFGVCGSGQLWPMRLYHI